VAGCLGSAGALASEPCGCSIRHKDAKMWLRAALHLDLPLISPARPFFHSPGVQSPRVARPEIPIIFTIIPRDRP
jgi:hypothetical protein